MSWELAFSKQALEDARKAQAAGLKTSIEALLELVREDPFRRPPPF